MMEFRQVRVCLGTNSKLYMDIVQRVYCNTEVLQNGERNREGRRQACAHL